MLDIVSRYIGLHEINHAHIISNLELDVGSYNICRNYNYKNAMIR